MIILYGSYARNTYVELDIRRDYGGGKIQYMSDYDILVVSKKRLGSRTVTVSSRVKSSFLKNKNANTQTRPSIINESITKFNNALSEGRYFYVDILTEGIVLYDSGECQLATPCELNYSEILQIAKEYYRAKLHKAKRHYAHYKTDYLDKEYTYCTFDLHQTVEHLIKAIPLVFILYGHKEHELDTIDEDTIWNKNLLELKLSDNPQGLSTKDAKNLLHYWGVYDAFCNKLPLRRVYDANELWSCLEYVSPETFSRVIDNMNSTIRKLEAKDNAQREKYAIEELLNVDDNLSLHILDTSYQSSFYKNLICSQFMAEYKSVMEENGVEEPLAQAYNGGMILRNMLGDKWDSNPASAYVGALLNHFQENSAFDLFAIENDVLSSFAAFCQKGDNIDRLVEYLVQVGFCNYKLAYGIYGATRGFTSLPKTFTSVLINGNKDYYQSFASNVWRMLNGIEIKDAVLPKASNSTSVIVESQLGSKIIENQNNVESKVVKQQKVVEAVNKAVKLENIVQSPKAFMYIFSSFSRITTTKAYKALDAVNFAGDEGSYTPEQFRSKIYSIVGKEGLKTQKENIDKAIELESKRQDPEAFLSILDNFLKPTDAAYKKIEKLISSIKSLNTTSYPQPQGNNVISQDGVEKRNLKPIHPTSSKFVEDANVNYFILSRNYLPIKMRETLSRKVITFQKGYAPGGKYYSNPLGNPIDNRSTIDHFKHWCFYDKGGYPPIVEGTYENKQYFEQLMQDLFNRYANR